MEPNAEIWVSGDGEQPEHLFARGRSGTQAGPWIGTGHFYLFKLYEGTAHERLLAWTGVTTQLPPATQIGFDDWPANNGWPDGSWGSAALDDANWSVLRPVVAADLDQHWFASLDEARTVIAAWRKDYNTVRPHTALANLTPAAFKAKELEKLRLALNG